MSHEITKNIIENLEQKMLDLPQVECPVVHHFGPGIYIREVTLPAGTLAIGHAQKFEHLNIVLKGSVSMIGENGEVKIIKAPTIFTGKPGRKFGFVLEECVWQNVYATNEKDIDKLESTFLEKSETWKAHDELLRRVEYSNRIEDRKDFEELIDRAGFTKELVRLQSENEDDQIPMPDGFGQKLTIRDSCIEGRGVFLSSPADENEIIAPARINGFRTPAGRFTNHSKNTNAKFVKDINGDIWLVAIKSISGCVGGSIGEEVTVDYRQALSCSGIYLIDEVMA